MGEEKHIENITNDDVLYAQFDTGIEIINLKKRVDRVEKLVITIIVLVLPQFWDKLVLLF